LIIFELFSKSVEILPFFDPATLDSLDSNITPYGPFVFIDTVLGIPKLNLYKVFNIVIHEYNSLLSQVERPDADAKQWDRLYRLTDIICLVTYDNLTAINSRKRFLQRLVDVNSENAVNALKKELSWLALLFSSPLPKQTKSSMLWQHRIWVYDKLLFSSSSNIKQPALAIDIQKELDLVIRANELHPRNYYAWSYARRLSFSTLSDEEFKAVLKKVIQTCRLHASDISCWSFLAFLLTNSVLTPSNVTQSYLDQILEYIEIVGTGHESIWAAVRLIVVYQTKVLRNFDGYDLVVRKLNGKSGVETIEVWLSRLDVTEHIRS
jgi:hypothetical protein